MLGIWRVSLTVSVYVLAAHPVTSLEDQCQQDGPCLCKFGKGDEIDLTNLGLQNGSSLIKDLYSGDYLYSFNPCYPFSEGTGPLACVNVASCQNDLSSGILHYYYNIGDADSPVLYYDGQKLVGNYSHQDSYGKVRLSTVDFICDPQAETPTVSTQGEIVLQVYKFTITSKHACRSGTPTPTPTPSHTTPKPWCTTDYQDFIKTCYYGYDGHAEPVKVLIIHEWNGVCHFPTSLDVAMHLYSNKATCQGVSNRCHPNQPFSVNNEVCKEP